MNKVQNAGIGFGAAVVVFSEAKSVWNTVLNGYVPRRASFRIVGWETSPRRAQNVHNHNGNYIPRYAHA